MFDSFKNALEGGGVSIKNGGIFLISETGATSASGLVSHFLSYGIANGFPVCFVSLQHTWGHFCNIGNKLGINLRQHAADGRVKVIEGLKLMSEVLDEGFENVNHPFRFILEPTEYPLKNLYNLIKETVHPWQKKNEHFLLVIDSLSFLLNLGIQTKDIEIFFNYCRNFLERLDYNEKVGTLVIVTKAYEKDEEVCTVINKVAHSAVTRISLEGLSTGLSREVHGNLRISVYNDCSPHVCVPHIQNFQFKMEDKNMKLFAPGTSAGVL